MRHLVAAALVASAPALADERATLARFEGALLVGGSALLGSAPEASARFTWNAWQHVRLSLRGVAEVGIPGRNLPDSTVGVPNSVVIGHQAWAVVPEVRFIDETLFLSLGLGLGQLVSGQCCWENLVSHGSVAPAAQVSVGAAFEATDGWRIVLELGARMYTYVVDWRPGSTYSGTLFDTATGVFVSVGVAFPIPLR